MGKAYYTGKQVINEALVGIRDMGRENYALGAMFFMKGYRDFSLFNINQMKESWETINTLNRTIALPEDCMRVEEVGVSINREIFTFTKSDDMISPSDPIDSQLLTARDENDSMNRSPVSGYGTKGANMEYYYKVDYKKRRIVLNRLAVDTTRFADRTEALLRFVSNDVDDLNEARVNGDAANMLISYVEWKLVASRPDKYDRFYRAEKRDEFELNEAKYRLLLIPSINEMLDVMYETSSQNVRI